MPCGLPTRVERVREWGKVSETTIPTTWFLPVPGGRGERRERAAPSSLTTSVPQGWGAATQCHSRVPSVEHVLRILPKWFQYFSDAVEFVAPRLRKSLSRFIG